MTFRPLIHLAFLCGFAGLVVAAETIPQSKTSQLIKLLHYSEGLKEFRETIVRTLNGLKENVKRPGSFWEDVERDVNMNQYSEWWISIVAERLSEKELIELNAIYSSPERAAILRELGRISSSEKGPSFDDAMKALRDSKGEKAVDEAIAFIRSEAFGKFVEALKAIQDGEREILINLLDEASKRVTARYNARP